MRSICRICSVMGARYRSRLWVIWAPGTVVEEREACTA
jgi:hypothetical protein